MTVEKIGFVAIVFSPEAKGDLTEQTGLAIIPVSEAGVREHGLSFQLIVDEDKRPEGVVHVRRSNGDLELVLTMDCEVQVRGDTTYYCGHDPVRLQLRALKAWMEARDIEPNHVFQVPVEFKSGI